MNNTHNIPFGEALEKTDFGFIVCGKTGKLKGLWIPIELQHEKIPEAIINICCTVFDIDPAEFFENDDLNNPTGIVH